VTVELDAERRAATTLGPAGGSVETTGADGTVYTLTLPEGALAFDVEIAITPVAAIADLPFGTLAGAAQFEPEGLDLFGIATLTIEPPGGVLVPEGQGVAGFDYTRTGDDFALGLVSEDGSSISIPVIHFSGAGSFFVDPNDFDLSEQGTPGGDPFIAEIFDAIDEPDQETRLALVADSFANWYAGVVRPRLQAAVVTDPALVRGAAEFAKWRVGLVSGSAAAFLGLDAASLLAEFDAEFAEADGLLAAALRDGIARANTRCLAEGTLVGAEDALRWMHVARALLAEEVVISSLLDRDSVLAELCVQVLFDEISFPEAPIAGEAETMRVVVGYAFGDGAPRFDVPIDVTAVGQQGVQEDFQSGQPGPGGVFETSFTPLGSENVRIDVGACLSPDDEELNLVAGICQTAFIVRGLIVSPIRATLEPGQTQQFTAELGGAAIPVTWTADGGTIDANGLFTAGSQPGSFTVTATSVANPDQTSTATVTVEAGEPSGFPTFAAWEGANIQHCPPGVCADGFTQNGELVTNFDPVTGRLDVRSCQGPGFGGASCLDNHCDGLWEGTVSGPQLSFTMVNHTSPCAIGDPGQNRGYGCTFTAEFSEDPDGTLRLTGSGDGSFFGCLGDTGATTTFEVCSPGCPHEPPPPPPVED
jgi:hypothetical protein